jgi:hypothetical protein
VIDGENRKYAAVLARRYFEGTVTDEAMLEHFGASEDPLIRELLLSILHEPRRGFWGVRESRWRESFWIPVSALLTELAKGSEGQLPSKSAVPRVTGWTFIGLGVLTLWAGASAAEHGLALWRGAGPTWELLVHATAAVTMTVAAALGVIGLRNRIILYRIRRAGGNSGADAG